MTKGFSQKDWENGHLRNVESYVGAVDKLYNKAIADISRLAMRVKLDPSKPFSFNDYPALKAQATKIFQTLNSSMGKVISNGSRDQWLYANKKSDAFLNSILSTSKIRKSLLNRMQDRNLDALKTFQARKVNGMDLSQRIWQYSGQFKESMELGIDVGIGAGKSAAQLSRELRGFLMEPNNLFRRVRDKHGNLVLSKAAKSFHPGQGVYRSSYKNAMRLTRSEINMSYRTADDLRWNQMNFVAGFQIKLSNNHTINGEPFKDICDELAGKYPKQFKFVGWHPQCRCYKTPILQDPDEFDTDELNELKAAINGTEYKKYSPGNTITDMPANFKTWAAENQAKVDGYRSTPYFIKDNFKYGKIRNGLKADFGAVDPIQVKTVPTVPPVVKTPPKVSRVPKALTEGSDYLKGTDIKFKDEFFDLLDPNKPVGLEIKGNVGSFYSPSEKKVVLGNGQRNVLSKWHRESVVYHEYGHAIDWQRGLRTSDSVNDLMGKYRKLLDKKHYVKREFKEWDWSKGDFKTVVRRKATSDLADLSARLDGIYKKLGRMSEETFKKRGISKRDVLEQIGSTQDTIMSLNKNLGWGHSKSYFSNYGTSQAEFVAHAFENTFIGNPVFKKYLPDLYTDMVDLIKNIK